MKTEIFKSKKDFLNRSDRSINGVSEEFAKNNPEYKKENETNKACWNCSDCSRCSGCFGCFDCSGENKEINNDIQPIVIENIHQKILEATSNPNSLSMDDWHTCDTTHCRAGWAVVLAGEKGKELEKKTSTLFAAMQIFKASSDIRVFPTRFFETNEVAMKDIKRCAKLESKN
jgi:hypothetical protein